MNPPLILKKERIKEKKNARKKNVDPDGREIKKKKTNSTRLIHRKKRFLKITILFYNLFILTYIPTNDTVINNIVIQ